MLERKSEGQVVGVGDHHLLPAAPILVVRMGYRERGKSRLDVDTPNGTPLGPIHGESRVVSWWEKQQQKFVVVVGAASAAHYTAEYINVVFLWALS